MENINKNLQISEFIKALPNSVSLAETYAENKREYVLNCRIYKESIANLGLYLGFIEGYEYVIEELKKYSNL